MTIEEKAREYALDALKEELGKVEKAYIDGYNAGQSEANKFEVEIDGIKYYDFGLPSGTLWSEPLTVDGQRLKLPFDAAIAQFTLPNLPNVQELERFIRVGNLITKEGISWLTVKGDKICMPCFRAWTRQECNQAHGLAFDMNLKIRDEFKGEKLDIVLVKQKEN